MGLENWVSYKSKADIQKEHDDYERKMFSLGDGHKELIKERIRELFKIKKLTEGDLMFNFLVLKQAYQNEDEDKREKAYFDWYKSVTSKYFSDDDRKVMIALVNADLNCTDLNNYPSSDLIREKALEVELVKPEKKKGLFSFLQK